MTDELKELGNTKKLLILLLQANEIDQKENARALGVSQPAVSQMLAPKGDER